MEKIVTELLFNFFVFPGMAFLTLTGMLVSWIDRKLTARIQWRVGPPLFQPFYDIRKLFLKEVILPKEGNRFLFVLSPVIAFLTAILIADIVLLNLINTNKGFVGDLIVILYLFLLLPLSSIFGASSSNNPLASIGAGREMKTFLSYELPLIMALLVPVVKAKSIMLGQIINFQNSSGQAAGSLSGIIAFVIAILCIQAKMGLVPFDASEAETEISGGTQIEYSGALLGLLKLTKMVFLIAGPIFLISMFWPGGNAAAICLKYFLLLVIAVLIRNTNPRLRADQSSKFFLRPVTVLSSIALLLAFFGV